MTQKITALVDGSIYSASVCDHAAWVSGRTGAPVELMHVLGRREGAEKQDLSGSINLGARTALLEELAELDAQRSKLIAQRGRAILEDAHAVLTKAGVDEITTRLRHGDIVEAMSEIEQDSSLILIGKRGEAADFAQGHLGSNLERIVRTSQKPIIVASRAFKPISKILLAFDGGASTKKAVQQIANNPLFAELTVHIITVGNATPSMKQGLEDARSELSAAGIEAETGIIEGQPETALGGIVEESNFDMVVMGAFGHSRIRNLIIGSTTTEMLRSCKVPVFLVR